MPKKVIISKSQKAYISRHYKTQSRKDMAKHLGLGLSPIHTFMKSKGYIMSRSAQYQILGQKMATRTTFTKQEDQYILDHYLTMPVKALAAKLHRSYTGVMGRIHKLGIVIPPHIVAQRKANSRFSPGRVPHNLGRAPSKETLQKIAKTAFKKGHTPFNTKYDGAISLRTSKGGQKYYHIRIAKGKWVPLHQHIWEQTYGTHDTRIYCLWFKNRITTDVRLENLELITREENVRRNRERFLQMPPDLQTSYKLINKLNKQIKQHGNKTTI